MSEDLFLEELGGCGLFQVVLVVVLSMGEISIAFTMMFMAFGIYNPGWRCLDDANITDTNDSNVDLNDTSTVWHKSGYCSDFEACKNVQFNSESSTLVSEWNLLCDKGWIASLIITVQMTGILIGAYLLSYLSDKVGRKRTFCMAVFVNAMLNLAAYFATNWQMFAVIRFFLGGTQHCIALSPYILGSEFSTWKWRSVIAGIPTWGVGGTLFALSAMMLRDWRQMHLLIFILTIVCFFPTLWAPESIRWLTLRGKRKEVEAIAKRIASINRHPLPGKEYFANLRKSIHQTADDSSYEYSWRYLWKGKALKFTLVFTPIWFVISLTYFTLSFGIKSLTGNFYTNLMAMFSTEILVFFLTAFAPNLLGRKKAALWHGAFNTACFTLVVLFNRFASHDVSGMAILVLVVLVRVSLCGQWYIFQVFQSELYPTVIRSTCLGYGGAVARIGSMSAPYLIPDDPDTYFISFAVMAALTFLCSLLVCLLPETKGQRLMDIWEIPEKSNPEDAEIKQKCSVT